MASDSSYFSERVGEKAERGVAALPIMCVVCVCVCVVCVLCVCCVVEVCRGLERCFTELRCCRGAARGLETAAVRRKDDNAARKHSDLNWKIGQQHSSVNSLPMMRVQVHRDDQRLLSLKLTRPSDCFSCHFCACRRLCRCADHFTQHE